MVHLIAMKGHPATGKSTLAHALARRLKWPLLDKDDIKDHLLGSPNDNALSYAILWQLVATQLRLGVNVIVDSPFAYPALYARAQQIAAEQKARLLVVETALAEDLWRRRLEERSPTESAHKIRGWQRMQEHLAHYNDCWRYPIDPTAHLVVDTAQPVEELLQAVQTRLFSDR